MKNSGIILGILIVLITIVLFSAAYIVNEKEQVIITQFGQPIGDVKSDPGLYFKIPIIQQANYFDRRFLEWDGDVNQIPTGDKRFIFVDTYARWHITDPLQFFRRLRDESGGQSRLDDILDGETRNAVASYDLLELVRSTNRTPDETEDILEELDELQQIQIGRDVIEQLVLERANERTKDLGIAILDFRFKRIDYVDDVRQRVFERMISERNRIAELFRSEGEGEARRIQGEMERELNRIESEAYRESEEIRGRAEAQSTAIYASAYNKNAQSRELYRFLRTLESYEKVFDNQTSIILSTDSDFFRYLKRLE